MLESEDKVNLIGYEDTKTGCVFGFELDSETTMIVYNVWRHVEGVDKTSPIQNSPYFNKFKFLSNFFLNYIELYYGTPQVLLRVAWLM